MFGFTGKNTPISRKTRHRKVDKTANHVRDVLALFGTTSTASKQDVPVIDQINLSIVGSEQAKRIGISTVSDLIRVLKSNASTTITNDSALAAAIMIAKDINDNKTIDFSGATFALPLFGNVTRIDNWTSAKNLFWGQEAKVNFDNMGRPMASFSTTNSDVALEFPSDTDTSSLDPRGYLVALDTTRRAASTLFQDMEKVIFFGDALENGTDYESTSRINDDDTVGLGPDVGASATAFASLFIFLSVCKEINVKFRENDVLNAIQRENPGDVDLYNQYVGVLNFVTGVSNSLSKYSVELNNTANPYRPSTNAKNPGAPEIFNNDTAFPFVLATYANMFKRGAPVKFIKRTTDVDMMGQKTAVYDRSKDCLQSSNPCTNLYFNE